MSFLNCLLKNIDFDITFNEKSYEWVFVHFYKQIHMRRAILVYKFEWGWG